MAIDCGTRADLLDLMTTERTIVGGALTELRFRVPGVAQPQGSMKAFAFRKRSGKLGAHVVTDNPKLGGWRVDVARAAQRAMPGPRVPFSGAVDVSAVFTLPRPKGVVRRWPTAKPDLDKLARAVLDALTGVVWIDDAQVIALTLTKIYTVASSDEPHTWIAVRPSSGGLTMATTIPIGCDPSDPACRERLEEAAHWFYRTAVKEPRDTPAQIARESGLDVAHVRAWIAEALRLLSIELSPEQYAEARRLIGD